MRRLLRLVLGAGLLFGGGFVYARYFLGPSAAELGRLRREHEALSNDLERRLRERALVRESPEATVLIGVPAPVAERLAGQVVAGLLREVGLRLRGLQVRKQDEVRAGTLVGRRTLGRFEVSVDIAEVRARIRPGKPRVTFAAEEVAVALPVTIAEGSGHGHLRFRWDGRGMAGAVCGDFEESLDVSGTVVPVTHTLVGTFHLSAQEAAIVAKPDFGEARVTVAVAPSAETWRAVDALVARRGAVCRAALGAANLRERLSSLLARGFPVTLPRNVLARELRLPASFARPLALSQQSMRLHTRPAGLRIAPARLWYGALVEVRGLTEAEAESGPTL